MAEIQTTDTQIYRCSNQQFHMQERNMIFGISKWNKKKWGQTKFGLCGCAHLPPGLIKSTVHATQYMNIGQQV
jgi:hypothetical protein